MFSSTTKTGRHDGAEILLKVALKHKKSITILFHMFLYAYLQAFTVMVLCVIKHSGLLGLFSCVSNFVIYSPQLLKRENDSDWLSIRSQ
jgi:hypothetical protein